MVSAPRRMNRITCEVRLLGEAPASARRDLARSHPGEPQTQSGMWGSPLGSRCRNQSSATLDNAAVKAGTGSIGPPQPVPGCRRFLSWDAWNGGGDGEMLRLSDREQQTERQHQYPSSVSHILRAGECQGSQRPVFRTVGRQGQKTWKEV